MRWWLCLLAAAAFAQDYAQWAASQGGTYENGRLSFAFAGVRDGAMDTVSGIPKLAVLDLSRAHITDTGMERLRGMAGVRELNLFFAEQITDISMAHIRGWRNLERLSVHGADITDTGLAHIATLRSLRSLDIGLTLITDVGLNHLRALTGLREVTIGGNKITGIGLRFVQSLPELRRLSLSGEQRRNSGTWSASITDFDMDTVASVTTIESLDLGGTGVTALGLAKLAALGELREIDVRQTRVTGAGLGGFAKLERIRAARSRFDDAGVKEVAALRLRSLDLSGTKITDAALDALAGHGTLSILHVDGTAVSAAAVERFRRRTPDCRVEFE